MNNLASNHGLDIDFATSSDSSHLRSLSVGSGYTDAGARWQQPSAMETEELEEYSLGSGLPG
jgi:hypothetical protein